MCGRMQTITLNGGTASFELPEEWVAVASETNRICLRLPDSAEFIAEFTELQKQGAFGTQGPSSEEMVRMQIEPFGGSAIALSPTRAFGSHAISIGEPGQERECFAWHLVNQAGPWHHQCLLFVYTPPRGCALDADLRELLDRELPLCEFHRPTSISAVSAEREPKPWWHFW